MSELASFHEFLSIKVKEFGSTATPEEVLDLWRATHPSKEEFQKDVKAVQNAIDEMNAGDVGIPMSEFNSQIRQKHSLA